MPEISDGANQVAKATESSGKLLVVGRESTFSKEIIDYTIDMADRMSYEVVALNTAPLSCETFMQSSSRDQVCIDFDMLAEQNAQSFREAAEKKSIPFTHAVKYFEYDEAIEELRQEVGEFEFVVSEEAHDGAPSEDEAGEKSKREIFVYALL